MIDIAQSLNFDDLRMENELDVFCRAVEINEPLLQTIAQIEGMMQPFLQGMDQFNQSLVDYQPIISSINDSISRMFESQVTIDLLDQIEKFQSLAADIKIPDIEIPDCIFEISEFCQTIDFSELGNAIAAIDFGDSQEIDFSDQSEVETKRIFVEELEIALEDQENWQQKLQKLFVQYKEKNPIFAGLIIAFLLYVLNSFVFPACVQLGSDLIMRVAPDASSEIIARTTEGQEALVVGDEPYYYEIEMTDPETGNVLRGYVSKRSMNVLEKREDVANANT